MDLRQINPNQKNQYNKIVTHVIQSWEWGEFRKSLGLPLLRYGIYKNGRLERAFQLTLHKIPFTNQYVGYMPKGPLPNKELAQALEKIGKEHNCAFIKVEPDIPADIKPFSVYPSFLPSPKPLFTKYNFVLDLTPTEEDLLKNMHSKTRYNIRVAQKHEVKVEERTDDIGFEIYLKLYFQTTQRQDYLGHNAKYHRKVWDELNGAGLARILIGSYTPKGSSKNKSIPLSAWMLLNFKDTLYYPYGGSSIDYREVMANNLVAWEAIKLGKRLNLKKFDMWGALGPNADPNDPWHGFHRFKQGYGGHLVEYIGTYDLVFNDPLYWAFTLIDKFTKLKVLLLKLIK
jgi:lipid II:glycine glycyltransferase (peptidoglycan interpeptide bridge formation enzyme)